VCYYDAGNSSYGTSCVLSISGTTITAGTPVVFESAYSDYISVTALSDTKALVCYRDNGNSSYGTSCVLSISGTTITAGTPVVFESANSSYISVTALSDTKALVCYRDAGNSNYGTSCVLSISGTTPSLAKMYTSFGIIIGKSNTSSLISANVSAGQILSGFSSLVPGEIAYADPIQNVNTLYGGYSIGIALNSTTIKLKTFI
jgi:hypothetical protein